MPLHQLLFHLVGEQVCISADAADTVCTSPMLGPASAAPVVALNARVFLARIYSREC